LKKTYAWLNHTLGNPLTLAAGTAIVADALASIAASELRDIRKVVRVFGQFAYRATILNNDLVARFGLVLASNDSVSASATADPIQDDEASWYGSWPLLWDNPTLDYVRFNIDLRSSRNLPQDYTLAAVVENSSTSVGILEYQYSLRFLLERS